MIVLNSIIKKAHLIREPLTVSCKHTHPTRREKGYYGSKVIVAFLGPLCINNHSNVDAQANTGRLIYSISLESRRRRSHRRRRRSRRLLDHSISLESSRRRRSTGSRRRALVVKENHHVDACSDGRGGADSLRPQESL